LDSKIVRDVVLAYNSVDYIYVFVKNAIYFILTKRDVIRINSEQGLARLEQINESMAGIGGVKWQ
jgi:hypothetical protein